MVGPVIFDAIKRYLVYSGYQVTWVVNITDVDDKLIAQSKERGIPMAQLADEMTADYMDNLEAMGVDHDRPFAPATEHMGEIIRFMQTLIDKGFAYESEGDVFFDVGKDRDYGKLSHRAPDSQQGEGGERRTSKRSPAISRSGKRPSRASRRGTAPGGRAGRAGTSSARR